MTTYDAGYNNGYAKGWSDGTKSGMAYEIDRNTLKRWDSVPDVDGWYWFKGEVYEYGRWLTIDGIFDIDDPETGMAYASGNHSYVMGDMRGTWYGPITQPWEAQP